MSRPEHARSLHQPLLALAPLCAFVLFVVSGCDGSEIEHAKKVVFDLTTISFTADRHFVADYGSLGGSVGGSGEKLNWVERVRSAGDGVNIAVELVERNGRSRNEISDPDELAAFDRLAATLATGGGPRVLFQRDPAPEDLDRLLANYNVSVIELGREPITPKGEPSLTYRLDPISADRPFYILTVSTRLGREGFPLECQEYVQDVAGPRLVSFMSLVPGSVDWKVPSVVAPESPIVSRTSYDSLDTIRDRAMNDFGLTLYLPQDDAMPLGFELVLAEEVRYLTAANLAQTQGEITLFRFVYSDGLESIEFVEHAPTDTMPASFVDGHNGLGIDFAMVTTFGSITIGSLVHAHTQITIESRIAADRFGPMLKALAAL